MTARRGLAIGAALLLLAAVTAAVLLTRARSAGRSRTQPAVASVPAPSAASGRKIKVRLFYVAEDGSGLTAVEHDVPYSEGVTEQARAILSAQIEPVSEPLVSAVPDGTALRSFFLTDRGDAYVDLSAQAGSAHVGGTLGEMLTVYTIVNVLTANLPVVKTVHLLVEGKEAPTLAGHVDITRPLTIDLAWVQ